MQERAYIFKNEHTPLIRPPQSPHPINHPHTQLTLTLMRRGVLGKEHRVPEPVLQFLLRGPKKASVQVGVLLVRR